MRLHLAAEGKAASTVRTYTEAVQWFAAGMRLSELAGIWYDPDEPQRSDLDLWRREVTVRGKGRKARTVKVSRDAARALDRYIRARARHAQAYRACLWLGINTKVIDLRPVAPESIPNPQ